jgi:hypothetical protein
LLIELATIVMDNKTVERNFVSAVLLWVSFESAEAYPVCGFAYILCYDFKAMLSIEAPHIVPHLTGIVRAVSL